MIESMVAISISTIGLLGIVGLLSQSLALNKDVGQKFVATYLAAEGIEVVKNLIDTNYTRGRSWNRGLNSGNWEVVWDDTSLERDDDRYLFFDPDSGAYNYNSSGNQTQFKRQVMIDNISADEIKVVSRVNWSDRGDPKAVSLEDHFFNWR